MDRPEISLDGQEHRLRADGLSHLLAWIRLAGETVYQTELRKPSTVAFPPGPSHVHFIESGEASLRLQDGSVLALARGDVVLLPHGLGHEMSLDETGSTLQGESPNASRLALDSDASPPMTRIIGGLFRYERQPLPPVIRSLPPVIHLKSPGGGAVPDWLRAMAVFLMAEANHPAPGSALMISRMIDLLVIRVLRSWADQHPNQARWLTGIGEERLGRALAAMHENPTAKCSVESLARLAAMSRSVFADRFAAAFGEPPLRYLMRWRFTVAGDLLAGGVLPIGEIARRVGYDSEPGFSRAFKAFTGRSPSECRSQGKSIQSP